MSLEDRSYKQNQYCSMFSASMTRKDIGILGSPEALIAPAKDE